MYMHECPQLNVQRLKKGHQMFCSVRFYLIPLRQCLSLGLQGSCWPASPRNPSSSSSTRVLERHVALPVFFSGHWEFELGSMLVKQQVFLSTELYSQPTRGTMFLETWGDRGAKKDNRSLVKQRLGSYEPTKWLHRPSQRSVPKTLFIPLCSWRPFLGDSFSIRNQWVVSGYLDKLIIANV